MRKRARQESAFLNIPYDRRYESLYLAFIAGLCAFGLRPRATIEIPSTKRRLERIIELIRGCRYSFHDLSRVQLDRNSPTTPRFNMPFELGLAVNWALGANPRHEWFVFESRAHRLEKSLSDLNGTDPHLHDGTAHGVLRGLTNALTRKIHDPNLAELDSIYRDLSKAAHKIKESRGGSLFEARPFQDLAVLARQLAEERISSLRS
ncbi:hypothetical protein [Candidatus Binatus sp.]|jgi:hypothetical protein|uniref:hypothetical protein n=1 Tax=Candidatus Binatus sp. TaxID=2811406 RepID=UPI003F954356